MSKDHTPGGFNRPSGYKSDLENSEERGTRINTSFGSGNHNVYVHNAEHTHEHFWYDPSKLQSGYHGENVPTKSNHPTINAADVSARDSAAVSAASPLPSAAPAAGTEAEEGAAAQAVSAGETGTGAGLSAGEDCTEGLDGGEECGEGLEM